MRGNKTLILFIFLVATALVFSDGSLSPLSFQVPGSRVRMAGLTISPSSIDQGGTIDFSITMVNDGTAQAVTMGEVAIYDINGNLTQNITFDSVTIAPSQTVVLTKTWDSDSNPQGIYLVIADAQYDGNVTGSLNGTFTISHPVLPSQPGGPQFIPVVLPPVITPVQGQIQFLKTSVLTEILAGEGSVESLTLKNTGQNNLTVAIGLTGVPSDWVTYQPNVTMMMPGELRVVNLEIAVPKDTLSGNYLIKMNAVAQGTSSQDFLVLRVKNYPEGYSEPIALKTIRIDQGAGDTEVSIDLKNPSMNRMKLVNITERIPAPLAGKPIQFMDKIGEISQQAQGVELVKWQFSDLNPLEEAHLTYTIGSILTEYSDYANWYVSQIETTEPVDMSQLISSSLTTGGQGIDYINVTASVLYVGTQPLNVTMLLEVPEGFSVEPATVTTTLIPRSTSQVNFLVKVPPQTASDVYTVRFVILGDQFSLSATSPIVIKKPPTAVSFSFLEAFGVNNVIVLSSATATIIAGVILLYRRRNGGGPEYNHERLDYMKSIKRMITKK